MKRSEMLYIIENTLVACEETMVSLQYADKAETVLRVIERAGMLPPFLPNKEHGYSHIDEDAKWENENE